MQIRYIKLLLLYTTYIYDAQCNFWHQKSQQIKTIHKLKINSGFMFHMCLTLFVLQFYWYYFPDQ